jgi:lysylphosphatidylglycerol synthetase-like protein (DUF2156 family)
MKNKLKQIAILLFLVAVLLLPYLVFAQGDSEPTSLLKRLGPAAGYAEADETTISGIAGLAVNAFLSLLGVIFIILMIYAGYNWMTAAGDEQKLTQAKNTLRRAIIGIVILLSAFAIWNFVLLRFIIVQ